MLYVKRIPDILLCEVAALLDRCGYTTRVIRYGHYGPQELRDAARRSEVAIFLSDSESQGIALAECWACNTPTFTWNPSPNAKWNVAAPWLTDATGFAFADIPELADLLAHRRWLGCSPRTWTIHHMSLASCGRQLAKIYESARAARTGHHEAHIK